jgi:hypothetical protein
MSIPTSHPLTHQQSYPKVDNLKQISNAYKLLQWVTFPVIVDGQALDNHKKVNH